MIIKRQSFVAIGPVEEMEDIGNFKGDPCQACCLQGQCHHRERLRRREKRVVKRVVGK